MRKRSRSFLVVLLLGLALMAAGCTQNEPAVTTSTPTGNDTFPTAYPGMLGTWRSDDGSVYFLNDTVQEMPASENTWVINAQDDRVISGFKTFALPDGTIENQTVVGIFNPDGKTISFIDQPGGWATGSLVDPDTLFIAWTNPGENTVSMAGTLTLHRQN